MAADRMTAYIRDRKSYKSRLSYLCNGAMQRSKIRNIPFDLTPEYLIELWHQQDGRCVVSGIPFKVDFSVKRRQPLFNAPSVDRIIPALGYIKGNVRLVCYQVNVAMSDYGLDTFLNLCKTVVEYQDFGAI